MFFYYDFFFFNPKPEIKSINFCIKLCPDKNKSCGLFSKWVLPLYLLSLLYFFGPPVYTIKMGPFVKQQINRDVFTVASNLCNLIFLLTTISEALITKSTRTEEFDWWVEEQRDKGKLKVKQLYTNR